MCLRALLLVPVLPELPVPSQVFRQSLIASRCDKAKATSTTSSCAQGVSTGPLLFCRIWIPRRRRSPYPSWSLSWQPTQIFSSQDSMLNERDPHQDSLVSTLAARFAPEGASLLETETLALKVRPFAMVSLSVVLLLASTSMTIVRWMVVRWMDVRWMDSDRLWS